MPTAEAMRLRATPAFPPELFEKPLFQKTADFVAPSAPLALARIDAHLRRLRAMPSTGDGTAETLLAGMARLREWGEKWLMAKSPQTAARPTVLQRIWRISRALQKGMSPESLRGLLDEVRTNVPPALARFCPTPGTKEPAVDLEFLALLLLDDWLTGDEQGRKRYLGRAYRIVDQALSFNTTTDSTRLLPVLRHVQSVLAAENRSHCRYVDVGCAVAGQAPGPLLAAEILAPFCRSIHGTDVTPPPGEFQRAVLKKHHVFLYQSNPVQQPLPRLYDVILLANVHRHLSPALQRRLLENLGRSLYDNGLLFINWRFDQQNSPGLYLKKIGTRMMIMGEGNWV
ncbi:MAG: class I SAM-dependent methyltransferase [Lentisphaerae bacterium]|nr:class I SAM-dependent methyltransferase [Lentisphaerota bacterium]